MRCLQRVQVKRSSYHRLNVNQRMDHGDTVGQAAALAPLGCQVRREQLNVLRACWSVRRHTRTYVVLRQCPL
jgi:hypothetical protein